MVSYVDHGECGLAVEFLSNWIYEDDIAVGSEQEVAILKSSSDYGVDPDYHAFVGRTPPYPDLRTPEQIAESERLMRPTMENVEHFARANQRLLAVKMYREITGVGLEEAVASVERIAALKT